MRSSKARTEQHPSTFRQAAYISFRVFRSVGEKIEVSMKMPRKITGEKASKRLFTGRVTHVNSQGTPPGYSTIGVHFLYYVLESGREQACDVAAEVRQ
jgi:hypothetical protein